MICIRYIGFGLLKILVFVVLAKSKCGLKVSLFKGNLASFQCINDVRDHCIAIVIMLDTIKNEDQSSNQDNQ